MKVIPQSQLKARVSETRQEAKGSIFRKILPAQITLATEAVDVAEQKIELDQDALCDLYESARKLLPGYSSITMPLEAVAHLLSPRVSWFEERILLQKLTHSQSAVLSMIPDDHQPSGNDQKIREAPQPLTVWFYP